MRNTVILLIVSISTFVAAFAQNEVVNSTKVVWCGLDFSKAKLVGSAGFTDPIEIKNNMLAKWNGVILQEAEKYNIKEYFNKKEVAYEISQAEKNNAKVDATKLVINDSYSFDKSEAVKIASKYRPTNKDGVGLVFIVESFDKIKEQASVYVTFFDLKTGKVLSCEKMTGKPGGFGLRNYWLGAILDIMKQSKKAMLKWGNSN